MKILTSLPKIDAMMKSFSIKNAICFEVGDLILFSGFAGIEVDTGRFLDKEPIEDHANAAIDCYRYILEEMGLSLDNVIKVNCFLADPADFPAWNETFKARFTPPYPCRTTVGAPLVVGKIELEFTASRTPRSLATLNS